ncbi:MAG TPA: hypothetical protein VFQ39_07420, partial [Longimicrobium sp.]|nr:hypothetical protein [Longimicrobium sp.]
RCDPNQRQTEESRQPGCVQRDQGPRPDRGVCPVKYYVDGQPLSLPPGATPTTEVHPAEVERIQVYTRAAEVPAEYARPGSECGVVLVWTRLRAR